MAFLDADRDTKERAVNGGGEIHHILAKDSTQFYKGQLVGVDLDDGKLMGVTAGDLTIQVVGRCEENVLTGSSNTRRVKVKSGCFIWANGGTYEAVTVANRGDLAYVVDDQTVGKSGATGGNCVAGRIYDFDSYGVHVFTQWPIPGAAQGATGATGPTGPTGPTGS